MKISNIETFGWKAAFRGMRNPKNSWNLSDSNFENGMINIGEKDLNLALSLIKGGTEHRKFLRMIHIQFDLDAPRYIWSEFDTYQFVVKNSCSTMHKLLTKDPITLDNFECDENNVDVLMKVIDLLNSIRLKYLASKNQEEKDKLLRQAKSILPESFLQKRTIDTNYETLLNIYFQRRNHRLPEWHIFCNQLLNLPYFNLFVGASTKNTLSK